MICLNIFINKEKIETEDANISPSSVINIKIKRDRSNPKVMTIFYSNFICHMEENGIMYPVQIKGVKVIAESIMLWGNVIRSKGVKNEQKISNKKDIPSNGEGQ